MNPYLEQGARWADFHTEFLSTLRYLLALKVSPAYFVQIEEHIYIQDQPMQSRQRLGTADVSLVQPGNVDFARGGGVGLVEAPAEVWLPMQDVERVRYLEVRDREGREVVTVIELLSPSNKRAGDDRQSYLAKRRELLRSPVHLVEIDLLRGWTPMPQEGRPECDYSVMVSRAEARPAAAFWPIMLKDRLPFIPIPLRLPDETVQVDLQEALNGAYDRAQYEHIIYLGSPEPRLSLEDAAWAQQFVPARA